MPGEGVELGRGRVNGGWWEELVVYSEGHGQLLGMLGIGIM